MNLKEHDTWLVAPALYARMREIDLGGKQAVIQDPGGASVAARFGLLIIENKHWPTNRIGLLHKGELVQVLEIAEPEPKKCAHDLAREFSESAGGPP